jgi:hypothetical protein
MFNGSSNVYDRILNLLLSGIPMTLWVQEKLREIMLFMHKEIEILLWQSILCKRYLGGTTGGGTTDTTVPNT